MEYIGNSIIQRITQKGTDSRVVFYTNIGDSDTSPWGSILIKSRIILFDNRRKIENSDLIYSNKWKL